MITKNYIKMCEQAGEIQKLRILPLSKGSFVIVKGEFHNNEIVSLGELSYYGDDYKYDILTWLPTQEQLQEMIKGMSFHIWGDFNNLTMSASTKNRDGHMVCKKVNSMNELWLAFVMKEKWNKIWTGKKWVKGGD